MALAATRLIALHKNKGMTVAACLKNRTDYIENPDKTEQGQYVSSYACSTLTADEEFMLTKRQYDLVNGRRQKSDVIAYQIRQSFRPGEISAEEANKVGYELAMRFTKGKHAFVVATHTDRQHIHNHVIFNSTALNGSRKFRDFFFSALAVQRLSDLICLEHQLSVIHFVGKMSLSACQIFSAYSFIALSAAKRPAPEIFIRDILSHLAVSCHISSARFCILR